MCCNHHNIKKSKHSDHPNHYPKEKGKKPKGKPPLKDHKSLFDAVARNCATRAPKPSPIAAPRTARKTQQ